MFNNKRVDDILEGLRVPMFVIPDTTKEDIAKFVVKKQIEVLEGLIIDGDDSITAYYLKKEIKALKGE